MSNLLKKISFPVKLMLTGFIPLIFLLYVSMEVHRENLQKIAVIEKFSTQVQQSADIATLIDVLQQERRLTFGFLVNGQGESRMMAQRTVTDEALARIDDKQGSLSFFNSYTFLKPLPVFRTSVDQKKVTAKEVMEYYTNAILRFNDLSQVSTENIPYLESLNNELSAQRLLSAMITYLGIIRSDIYQDLYTKNVVPENKDNLVTTYAIYHNYEREFLLKADTASIALYRNILKQKDVANILAMIDGLIRSGTYINSDVDTWWNSSARAVDELKEVQRQVIQNVLERSRQINQQEIDTKDRNLFLLLLVIVLVITIVLVMIRSITDSLTELKKATQKIATGATGLNISIHSKDVISELTQSILLIDANNILLTDAANKIGNGNFDVEVKPRSKEDILGNAVAAMKTGLSRLTRESEATIWVQTGLSRVNDSTRGEKEMHQLSKEALDVLVSYLHAQVGLLYVSEGDFLEYAAGYAVGENEEISRVIPFGETIPGQVALDKKLLHLKEVPGKYMHIKSFTGSIHPPEVMVIPLVQNGQTEGVIELAAFLPFPELSEKLLEQATTNIAIALQAAKSRKKLQELLEETQAQSEELQAQHSEMENLNTELEAQTQKLQASEEELKVQQEELQQTNGELEERTLLLEERNQEIRKKAAELELSTKYKSEFLANMSHELRTPLNSILLLSRLLSENNDKNLNTDQVEYAQVIQSSGNGLLGLIDEILDLSKIEAGKMELEYREIAIEEIVQDVKGLFLPVAKEKNITLVTKIGEGVPAVLETDRTRLEQILRNLLSNAIKFTAKGAVTFEVNLCQQKKNSICFVVRDTGIGIPQDKHGLIFEAFQQADGSTRRKYGGTGLGLSISREISRLLGGEITLHSEAGKGSEFTLLLPLSKPAQIYHSQQEALPGLIPDYKEPGRYKSPVIPENIADDRENITATDKSILIVEDDVHFAKSLLDFTRKRGYKGIVTVRGDEAMELACRYAPSGIMLDIELPVKNGWEVMDELKGDGRTRHIPVHIMSSHKVKKQSLRTGAVDHIDKPVAVEQMQEIFQRIEDVLNRTSKKVLIIEDNNKHAKALAYFLETHQIASEVKSDITESIETLKKEAVDCVILDMGIPDQKAYALLEEARKNTGFENLPIIIFTGKSLSMEEEQRIKRYADSIVVKTAQSYKRMHEEVTLFLHLVEESNQRTPGETKPRLSELNQVLKGKTVLVVDDDVRNIFSLSRSLENLQMKVITAIDGNEALAKLSSHPDTDIVLLDMMMPELDGYETARRIRENREWTDLPVIAVTAKAMTGDREKCIRAGASDYITKPVDIDQLLSLLRVWLYEKA